MIHFIAPIYFIYYFALHPLTRVNKMASGKRPEHQAPPEVVSFMRSVSLKLLCLVPCYLSHARNCLTDLCYSSTTKMKLGNTLQSEWIFECLQHDRNTCFEQGQLEVAERSGDVQDVICIKKHHEEEQSSWC